MHWTQIDLIRNHRYLFKSKKTMQVIHEMRKRQNPKYRMKKALATATVYIILSTIIVGFLLALFESK